MKKIYLTLLFIYLIPSLLHAEDATFAYVKTAGSTLSDQGKALVYSNSGFIYATGTFQGTVDFDGAGAIAPITAVGSSDIFILKYDLAGNIIWLKSLGGTSSEESSSIALDQAGNLYITGFFYGTVDFNPGATTNNLTSAGNADVYICKLDSNGNYRWAKKFGGAFDDYGNGIAIDNFGGVITAGSFKGTVDFNPNTPVLSIATTGNSDIFISKLDTAGNFSWAKTMGSTLLDDASSVKADMNGNVFIAGLYRGTIDFNPGVGTNSVTAVAGSDAYICKLDSAGNYVFAQSFGDIYDDDIRALAINSSGDIHAFGNFVNGVNFDYNGASVDGSLTSLAGVSDMFILKMNNTGGFTWVKQLGGTAFDQAIAITTDLDGNIYTTGSFQLTSDFDPGAGIYNLTSGGTSNMFVSKLDNMGDFVWAKQILGANYSGGYAITVDGNKNIYSTGVFFGSVDMDPSISANQTSASVGQSDYYLLKYNFVLALPVNLSEFNAVLENDVTQLYWATESEKDNDYFVVERSEDGLRFTELSKVKSAGPSNIQLKYYCVDPNPNKYGKTFYRLKQVDIDGAQTLSDVVFVQMNEIESKIQLFPNPTSSNLNILFPEELYFKSLKMEILDLKGSIKAAENIMQVSNINKVKSLDITALPSGMYFIKISTNQGQTYTQSLIKK